MNIKEAAMGKTAMSMGTSAMSSVKNLGNVFKDKAGVFSDANQKNTKYNPIDWNNYNYPPMVRLYHFQTNQVKQPALGIIMKMRVAADLIILVSFVNFINNVI